MSDSRTTSVGDVIKQDIRAAVVFSKYGIDFCCKAGVLLDDACEAKGLSTADILKEIEAACSTTEQPPEFNSWPLGALINHIVDKHHAYVRESAPIIEQYLNKLCMVHGPEHPELFEIAKLFRLSATELTNHMLKEEAILFPFIKLLVDAKRDSKPSPVAPFGTVENPVNMMKHEHEVEGARLRQIAELANNYQPPADACNTYRAAYSALLEFGKDLHVHIHLENNILFPKAVELEAELRGC